MMIVAEISGEHCGDYAKALNLIGAAKLAGCDAVKFQCFDPERLAERRGGGLCTIPPWVGMPLVDLYRKTQTPREWFPGLFTYCANAGIECFASVFDTEDVDYLETLDCPRYKVASYENQDADLIARVHMTGKPMIISGKPGIIHASYLYCVSEYPTPPEHVQLKRMVEGGYNGFSDHTTGITASIAAAAMGAQIIEKHITLDRANGGPDASFSIGPNMLGLMVKMCREAALMVA